MGHAIGSRRGSDRIVSSTFRAREGSSQQIQPNAQTSLSGFFPWPLVSIPQRHPPRPAVPALPLSALIGRLTGRLDRAIFPLFWKYEYINRCRFTRCFGAGDAPQYLSLARPPRPQGPSRGDHRPPSAPPGSDAFLPSERFGRHRTGPAAQEWPLHFLLRESGSRKPAHRFPPGALLRRTRLLRPNLLQVRMPNARTLQRFVSVHR